MKDFQKTTNLKNVYLLYKEMASSSNAMFGRGSPRSGRELFRKKNDEIRDVCSSSKVFKVSLT